MPTRLLLVIALLAPLGCSSTPGDAAYRSNHPEKAADLYRRGAEQGDSDAALKLGLLLQEQTSLITEYGAAGQWFVKACDLSDVVGCHNAGVGFEYGKDGLRKDYDHARDYYEKAASRGYMQSQYNLGTLYSNQYFRDDVSGLMWLLAAQETTKTCASMPLCKWFSAMPRATCRGWKPEWRFRTLKPRDRSHCESVDPKPGQHKM